MKYRYSEHSYSFCGYNSGYSLLTQNTLDLSYELLDVVFAWCDVNDEDKLELYSAQPEHHLIDEILETILKLTCKQM